MRDDVLTKVFIGMVIVGAGLLLYSQKDSLINSSNSEAIHQQKFSEEMKKIKELEKAMSSKPPVQNIVKEMKVKKVKEPTAQDKLEIQSKKAKEDFQVKVKAKMNLPKNLRFVSLDLEEEAEVIYGYDELNDLGLTMMAVPKIVKNEEVLPYLDESQSFMPDLKKNPVVSIGKPQELPKPKESTKLKSGTLWSGKLQDGKDVHIAKLERGDEKGSYFFMYTGPSSYFNNNEGYFENLLDNFEALPE